MLSLKKIITIPLNIVKWFVKKIIKLILIVPIILTQSVLCIILIIPTYLYDLCSKSIKGTNFLISIYNKFDDLIYVIIEY